MKRKISPEGVALIRLLDCLDDSLVYPKADGDREQGQGDVGCDADDAEHCQWEQQEQAGPKHHPGLLDVSPVKEVNNYNGREVRN